MKKQLLATLFLFLGSFALKAQTDGVAIDYSGSPVREPKAIMQLNSTVQGFIIPRMNAAQRVAIAPPGTAEGMTVYQTDAPEGYYFWDGAVWMQLANATGGTGYIQNQSTGVQTATFWINSVGRVGNGSAGAPSLSFDGSSTAGIFRPAADVVAISTASVERMRVDAAGNVGIGSNNPGEKLEINGAVKLGTTVNTNSGTIRWNSTSNDFEGYDGTKWNSLSGMAERTWLYTKDN